VLEPGPGLCAAARPSSAGLMDDVLSDGAGGLLPGVVHPLGCRAEIDTAQPSSFHFNCIFLNQACIQHSFALVLETVSLESSGIPKTTTSLGL